MSAEPAEPAAAARALAANRRTIALAGLVALSVAVGIGRFAFTPLLPMMLNDGVIDLRAASWLASANYLGYLTGALLCTFQPWLSARAPWLPPVNAIQLLRGGLVATALLTLGMALPVPALWPLLRFAAGVASAVVFVYTSGWCLAQLARLGAPALGALIYAGPGAGIVVSGLFASAMVAWHWQAATGWLIFGALAAGLSAAIWGVFRRSAPLPVAPAPDRPSPPVNAAPPAVVPDRRGGRELAWLALGYGGAGFGYIVTATFLPVIARAALPGSAWLDLFWPLFGVGTFTGAVLTTRLRLTGDLRRLLVGAYLVQAAGIAISLWSPTLAGFALGSLLLGLPFTSITYFAMQEVRRLRPAQVASSMGLLTAVYGVGQIVGPPLVALLLHHSATPGEGFTRSLEVAFGVLLAGALLFLWLMRAHPLRTALKLPTNRTPSASR